METRAHHIVIGFFTLGVAAAAMVFALWLGKSGNDGSTRLYDIVFEESVTGLSVGSQVLYNGIRMGEVVNLSLDRKDPRKVLARIRIADSVPVTIDTGARLTIANITGAAIIQLISGPPGSPPLKRKGSKVPVIIATPSPFTRLRTSSEELLVNISQLVSNAGKILSDENIARLTNIIAHVDTTTGAIAGEKESISTTLQELASASAEIHKTMAKVSLLLEGLNTGMEEHGDDLLGNAQKTLKSLEQLSTSLDSVVTGNQGSLNQGLQGLAEIGPMLEELRATISTLGEISRRLEDDPGGYLLGGEKVREFQP